MDPRAVKVLVVEVARSPVGRMNQQSAFTNTIELCVQMLTRAQAAGELRPEVDPRLSAMLLFGTIEMAFTALVMGVVDIKDPEKVERAKRNIAGSFLQGVQVAGANAEDVWMKEPEKSATTAKVVRR